MFGQGDRRMLQTAHGVPSDLRDASGSGKFFNKEPTVIRPPTNSTVRKERPGHGFTRSDLGKDKPPTGNVTARQTLTRSGLLPPAKRQKVETSRKGEFVLGRGTPRNQVTSSKSEPTPLVISYIDVDADDNQIMHQFQSTKKPGYDALIDPSVSSEELDGVKDTQLVNEKQDRDVGSISTDYPAAESFLAKRKSSPPRFRGYDGDVDELEYVPSSSQASGSRQVKDGAATRALESQVGLSSDPISDSSPPPQGRVKQMVHHIEQNKTYKHVDLRVMAKSGIKNSMRTKNSNRQKANILLDETMTPTPFMRSSKRIGKLWIEKWFFGAERRENPKDCYISWEQNTLTVWEDDQRIVWFKLKEELGCVEYCENEPFVVKLMTKVSSSTTFDHRNHDYFELGASRILGEVVIWVEKRENVQKTYELFISWLKQHKQKCMVSRGPAGNSMWTTASNGAEVYAQTLRRQYNSAETDKGSLKRTAPPENDHDFTPPPVDELSRDSFVPPDTSVSSLRSASRTMLITRNSGDGLRRSTRRRRSPSVDPEEVILCYPQGVPGAVYIKNSDYRRLRPGEYLNDTLIEFGLKVWLSRLQESNPELASQVHVFSSFFYHLLDNKNPEEGYESVRKWTAKINIFSKKYIIVPINDDSEQHWYLAIIYHPEHILTPTNLVQEKTPTTQGVLKSVFASRPSPSPSTTETSLSASGNPGPPSSVVSIESLTSANDVEIARMIEVEEERSVSEGLLICHPSCSVEVETVGSEMPSRAASNIENDMSDNGMTDVTALSDPGTTPTERASDMDVDDRETSPLVSDHTKTVLVDHIIHDVDMQDVPSASSIRTNRETTSHIDDDVEQASTSIAPANFYGMSTKAMGKQKAIPNQAVLRRNDRHGPAIDRSVGVKDDDHDEDHYEDNPSISTPEIENTTYIFTFDSLGTERLPAIERLGTYLKQEAQDKLKKSDTGDAVGFKAQVPVQPNFYDCGLYLLHFAKTFMNDPVKYSRIIRTRGKGPVESRTRKIDWKYEQTVDMRERFREDIGKLSAEWKKDRAEKEEAKRKEAAEGGPSIQVIESSDDEIDIVETTPAPAPGKTKKKGGKRKSPKKDTSVMRLR